MRHLIIFILSTEKAMQLGVELKLTKLDCHGLYFDANLLKCARIAGALGFLNWS
jgi:hypothetical protein